MMDRLNRGLERRAHIIAERRAQKYRDELSQILQEAVPDGEVRIAADGRIILGARRLFARMLDNDKLRHPISFLNGDLG